MKTKAICDTCNKPIDKEYYTRDNYNDEHFCSKDCLIKEVISNLEIEKRSFDE